MTRERENGAFYDRGNGATTPPLLEPDRFIEIYKTQFTKYNNTDLYFSGSQGQDIIVAICDSFNF